MILEYKTRSKINIKHNTGGKHRSRDAKTGDWSPDTPPKLLKSQQWTQGYASEQKYSIFTLDHLTKIIRNGQQRNFRYVSSFIGDKFSQPLSCLQLLSDLEQSVWKCQQRSSVRELPSATFLNATVCSSTRSWTRNTVLLSEAP